jgi:hypothetical protein
MILTGLIKLIELLSAKGPGKNAGSRVVGGADSHGKNSGENPPAHPSDTKHYRRSGGNGSGIRDA